MQQSRNLSRACRMLKEQQLTCAFVKDDAVYVSKERGVRPLLVCYKNKQIEEDFSAADKVVGKAAAFLYVLLGVKELYTDVISTPALQVLRKEGIDVSFGCRVDAIYNRAGTGFCPMETAVTDIYEPSEALKAVEETLAQIQSQTAESMAQKGER